MTTRVWPHHCRRGHRGIRLYRRTVHHVLLVCSLIRPRSCCAATVVRPSFVLVSFDCIVSMCAAVDLYMYTTRDRRDLLSAHHIVLMHSYVVSSLAKGTDQRPAIGARYNRLFLASLLESNRESGFREQSRNGWTASRRKHTFNFAGKVLVFVLIVFRFYPLDRNYY